ncbi:MAG TPA: hypothetical protein VK442_06890 [Xanthobacteraceae bacterium]|nr:hypothetical protein [Xanthobacteraceae bacterium]
MTPEKWKPVFRKDHAPSECSAPFTLTIGMSRQAQEIVNFVWHNGRLARSTVMSETADTELKAVAMRGSASEKHALAQVEKWMAMIREISRERQAQPGG